MIIFKSYSEKKKKQKNNFFFFCNYMINFSEITSTPLKNQLLLRGFSTEILFSSCHSPPTCWFSKITYPTSKLKGIYTMFTLSSYVGEHVQVWILCLWLVSRPPKSGWLFLENLLQSKFWNHFQAEIIPLSLWFSYSLPYGLEESIELRALISWIWDNRNSKMQKISTNFLIPRGVSICKILPF